MNKVTRLKENITSWTILVEIEYVLDAIWKLIKKESTPLLFIGKPNSTFNIVKSLQKVSHISILTRKYDKVWHISHCLCFNIFPIMYSWMCYQASFFRCFRPPIRVLPANLQLDHGIIDKIRSATTKVFAAFREILIWKCLLKLYPYWSIKKKWDKDLN